MYAVGKLYSLWKIYTAELGKHIALYHMAMSGHVVYGVEGDGSGLCRSYETEP